MRNRSLALAPPATGYLPATAAVTRPMTVVLRTAADPLALVSALHDEVRRLSPIVPLFGISTMELMISANSAQPRWHALLVGAFAALALLLGALGIYGVLAYSVTLRTREIGLRIALGATCSGIEHLIVGEGLWVAGIGIGSGVVLAVALGRLAANLLYGVTAAVPATLAAVVFVLALVAIAAAAIPAGRAARVDPLTALREE